MARSQEWKAHRDGVIQARKDRASQILRSNGIDVLSETKYSLVVRINCHTVEYFPFTGSYRGKGIPSGRELKNLIALKR